MLNRASSFILVALCWDWKSAFMRAQECEDSLSYCDRLEPYCDDERYGQFTRTNCKVTCKRCPEDVDPNGLCKDNGGCQHICEVDEENKTIKACKCYTGYKLLANGIQCEDVDECQIVECSPGMRCSNTPGGFSCDRYACVGKGQNVYADSSGCCQKPPANSTCGITNDYLRKRIIGGNITYAGQWPWQVVIMMNSDPLCGGTLLHNEWVVSSALCLKEYIEGFSTLDLYFGVIRLRQMKNKTQQKRGVKKITTHPNWGQERSEINDIALIQLDRPVQITKWVKSVCLPNGESPKTGSKCFAAQFGLNGDGSPPPSTYLQFVALPIIDGERCENNYKNEERKVTSTFMICAGYDRTDKDICRGDLGGPLVCQRCDSCAWYLAGVVSFGSGCTRSGLFGVYADVRYYENWISQVTSIPITNNGTSCAESDSVND